MESKICMNASCRKTTTTEWKKGWALRSGGFADLCYRCGSAYENSLFCDTFHLEQSGWRECYLCSKRLHCGCISSAFLIQLLDYGGVGCTTCASCYQVNLYKRSENCDGFGALTVKVPADKQDTNFESRLSQLCQIMEANKPELMSRSQRSDTRSSLGEEKCEEIISQHGEAGKATQPAVGFAKLLKPHSVESKLDVTDTQDSLSQPSLSMPLGVTSSGPPFSSGSVEGKEQPKASSSQKLPKPLTSSVTTPLGTVKTVVSQMRIARPPVEGRGKNHLLPRYWPRITDQELQKISGDLNSSVVPLFEKVLSASDAGRIGRLVLPKACAEAYFPAINQSEGIPLRIQDVKGKEWTFQFRFWPNNNSRMYVLEGVTPCIQSMQLQAGDTVTFSRIDPDGKLVMGFRKSTNLGKQQGLQASTLTNGISSGETSSPGLSENLSIMNGKDLRINGVSEHLNSTDGDIGLDKNVINGGRISEDSSRIREKKRTRNIGFKSKRLLMHNEEAMELRLTWEEAQDLLRPPPSAKPSIVTVEDHEFEEYDEPPVFGKRTVFISRPSGGQEQWAQCDDCSKWRRLPVDVLLSSNWICSENVWDTTRCSCAVAEETSLKELEHVIRLGKGSDSKKRRIIGNQKAAGKNKPSSGLDALASAAVLGGSLGEPSVGATTRHPRHRPGCTCIVCIQPPSGKGKHKPTCTCNVCMTVKRRFKTLMQRKKNRQLEREAKASRKDQNDVRTEPRTDKNYSDNEVSQSTAETSTAWIDLNTHPHRDELLKLDDNRSGILSLLQLADQVTCGNNMKRNIHLVSSSLSQVNGQAENESRDEGLVVSAEREPEQSNEECRDASLDTKAWP